MAKKGNGRSTAIRTRVSQKRAPKAGKPKGSGNGVLTEYTKISRHSRLNFTLIAMLKDASSREQKGLVYLEIWNGKKFEVVKGLLEIDVFEVYARPSNQDRVFFKGNILLEETGMMVNGLEIE